MPSDFGCFIFDDCTPHQQTILRYAINYSHPLAPQAWDFLTGQKENPKGHKPLFLDNEWPQRISEVQRILHAYTAFGGEKLVFLFDSNFNLIQIHLDNAHAVLWKSSPELTRLSSTQRAQRYSNN